MADAIEEQDEERRGFWYPAARSEPCSNKKQVGGRSVREKKTFRSFQFDAQFDLGSRTGGSGPLFAHENEDREPDAAPNWFSGR